MKRNKAVWILVLILLVFFVVEFKGLSHFDIGDENAYFYMGKLVSEGVMPYRDFFFAHPPLKLLVITPIMVLFGFNLIMLKLVPLICTILTAIFLFKIMKLRFNDLSAILTVVLFLFTKRVMLEATYFLGINLTAMFVVIGLYFLVVKRRFLSGVFYGIAAVSGLYAVVPFIVILGFLVFKKRFWRFLLGFLAVFLLVNLLMMMVSTSYIDSVYKYHLIKPKVEGKNFKIIEDMVKENFFLFVLPLLLLLKGNSKGKKKLLLVVSVSLGYLLFLTQIRLFGFYFVLLFPFLAILSGYGLSSVIRRVKNNKIMLMSLLIILGIIFSFSLYNNVKHLYTFDFVDFQGNSKIVDYVKENSDESDKLFGDVLTVPLIALETDRDIAFNLVDSNAMRFLSGSLDFDEELARIKNERVKFVIVRPGQGFGNNQKVADFLNANCRQGLYWDDKYWGEFFVFDCEESSKS
jgi:4-amino-4-deoxy-L-arabinose transferase-like glycosyltransferase